MFVRTGGCDLRCRWCDEPEALESGELLGLDAILERIAAWRTRRVEITGGEPLLQKDLPDLVAGLLERGHELWIETGGHRDISVLDPRVHRIVDVKAPGSGECARNLAANLDGLRAGDEIKFVLADRADYEWARDRIRAQDLGALAPVNLSPVHGELDPAELAAWLLEDELEARLNLQLHKYIWGSDARQR